MSDPVEEYYDPMAEDYHLLFADWRKTVLEDGETLDKIIRAHLGTSPGDLLDCACGIGTQALGLATHGYQVHATDLSPVAIARARREAHGFDVSLTFGVADLRSLETQVAGEYSIVLACDNALPHCLTQDELVLAVRNLKAKLREDGLLVASMRDYDAAVREKAAFMDPHVYEDPDGKRLVFQVWEWAADGKRYQVNQFILKDCGGDWRTRCYSGEYRALLREELSTVLGEAGFTEIRWKMPEESGYYQPLVTARKRV